MIREPAPAPTGPTPTQTDRRSPAFPPAALAHEAVRRGMPWFHRLRLRVLGVLVAGVLAAWALAGWLTLPAWPVVGVAVLTVAAVVHKMTARVGAATCWSCGADLAGEQGGAYGVVCRGCGSVNQHVPGDRLA